MNSQLFASTFSDREALQPPPPAGMLRAVLLAVAAHLLLLLALTHGLQWKRETQNVAAEAELWSRVPQAAAPREVAPPPPPPVVAPPVVTPPVVRAPPLPEPPLRRDAEIALEREKQRREANRLAEEKREAAERREAAEQRQAAAERDRKRRLEAQRKREEELEKREQQARLAAEAKRKEDEKKRRQQEQEEKRVAQLREENLRRMQVQAGSGSPSSTGAAAQASGPSTGWAARVQARVRPNIVFSEAVSGNPRAEVEVRTAPDGTIVARKLVRSSGVKAWDEAVLRALDKTEALPRDTDGRVPSPVVIGFRPKG